MSLNQLVNYEKNEIIKNEIKARKLGIMNGTDGDPVFSSNTGDKSLVTRKYKPLDFPYGQYRLYTDLLPYILEIEPAQQVDYYVIEQRDGAYQGGYWVDFRNFKKGDRIDLEYYGHYSNSVFTEFNTFDFIRLAMGNQLITWDSNSNNDEEARTRFPSSPVELTYFRQFRFKFQIIANNDWDDDTNTINVSTSGSFFASIDGRPDRKYSVETATYRMKTTTLTQASMGKPDPDIIKVLGTGTNWPAVSGFILYYQGMNYRISTGSYPVSPP
jgi:hypothetical protein